MADRTKIEWSDATWNPIAGCTRVSEACRNCYATPIAARFRDTPAFAGLAHYVDRPNGTREARWTGAVTVRENLMDQPLRWQRPRRIFVNSMSDLFHDAVPDEVIDDIFAVMALCPQHTFQILTKRPERMLKYIKGSGRAIFGTKPLERVHLKAAGHMEGEGGFIDVLKDAGNIYSLYLDAPWPLPNVWLGVSVEDQVTTDVRVPYLLATPAAIRFVSYEPALGAVDLRNLPVGTNGHVNALSGETLFVDGYTGDGDYDADGPRLDLVIMGGESGPNARPMHPGWARQMRDQCAAAAVPFFFKQWGEWVSVSEVAGVGPHHRFPDGATVRRTGKRIAGRTLDHVEHNDMPEVRHG